MVGKPARRYCCDWHLNPRAGSDSDSDRQTNNESVRSLFRRAFFLFITGDCLATGSVHQHRGWHCAGRKSPRSLVLPLSQSLFI